MGCFFAPLPFVKASWAENGKITVMKKSLILLLVILGFVSACSESDFNEGPKTPEEIYAAAEIELADKREDYNEVKQKLTILYISHKLSVTERHQSRAMAFMCAYAHQEAINSLKAYRQEPTEANLQKMHNSLEHFKMVVDSFVEAMQPILKNDK